MTAELDLYRLTRYEYAAVSDRSETHHEAKSLQGRDDLGLGVIVEERTGDEYAMHGLFCGVVDDPIELRDAVPSAFLTVDGATHEGILEVFGHGRDLTPVEVHALSVARAGLFRRATDDPR